MTALRLSGPPGMYSRRARDSCSLLGEYFLMLLYLSRVCHTGRMPESVTRVEVSAAVLADVFIAAHAQSSDYGQLVHLWPRPQTARLVKLCTLHRHLP